MQGGWKSCSSTILMWPIEPVRLMGMSMRSLDAPCLGENCRFCTRHEDREQLADTSQKLRARAAHVVGPILPLAADEDEESGNLAWSTAQREDPVLGPVYGWVRVNKRPSREEVAPFGARTKAYCAQWKTLAMRDNILYCKSGWRSPWKELPG